MKNVCLNEEGEYGKVSRALSSRATFQSTKLIHFPLLDENSHSYRCTLFFFNTKPIACNDDEKYAYVYMCRIRVLNSLSDQHNWVKKDGWLQTHA